MANGMYRRELLKGSTDTLLLSILAERPLYGYHIVKEIQQRSSGYFHFKEGTLYPALHRMEREKLIEGKWARAPGGQQRRYYFITDKGRLSLASMIEEWRQFSRAVNLVAQPEAP